jgi:hypothetical protein
MLRPTIAVALVFRTLDALRVFDVFQIVLAQSRYSMASFTYYELINNRAMGYSSASSVIIFVLILIRGALYQAGGSADRMTERNPPSCADLFWLLVLVIVVWMLFPLLGRSILAQDRRSSR